MTRRATGTTPDVCRLTAYLGEPLRVSLPVFGGEHPLYEQSWAPEELITGSVNADGYGVVWAAADGLVRVGRSEPIWFAPDLEELLDVAESRLILAALRNGTPGIPPGPSAVPPVVSAGHAFVLNGFVPSFRERHMRRLRSHLSDELYAELRGSSDTETLLLLCLQRIREGAALGEAVRDVASLVFERVGHQGDDECQLTMVMTDGRSLAFLRSSNRERVNSLYRMTGGSVAPEGTLLASERLDDDDGWAPVEAHVVMELGPDGERRLAL